MAMFAQQHGLNHILKEGGQHFAGIDEAIVKNIEACRRIGEITASAACGDFVVYSVLK